MSLRMPSHFACLEAESAPAHGVRTGMPCANTLWPPAGAVAAAAAAAAAAEPSASGAAASGSSQPCSQPASAGSSGSGRGAVGCRTRGSPLVTRLAGCCPKFCQSGFIDIRPYFVWVGYSRTGIARGPRGGGPQRRAPGARDAAWLAANRHKLEQYVAPKRVNWALGPLADCWDGCQMLEKRCQVNAFAWVWQPSLARGIT